LSAIPKAVSVGSFGRSRGRKVLLIVINSDRSSCGAYNSTLIKLAKQTIRENMSQAAKGDAYMEYRKKGYEHFAKNNFKVDSTYKDIFLHLNFENVQACTGCCKRF
jgi:F-type H+-transporting ATPase subunit gamma